MARTNPPPDVAESTAVRPGGWRPALGRLLVVAGLCAVAVAQPTLDLLGGSPSTFQVNRIERAQIVAFALAIVLVPPLLLWVMTEVVSAIRRDAGRVLHVASVGVLAAAFGVLTAKELTGSSIANSAAGLLVGVLVAWGYTRFAGVGSWLQILSGANVVFLALFVFVAPVSEWIGGGTQQAIDLDIEFDTPPPPVVMVVFDEWSTRSILAEDERIDEVRFPNLARLAEDAVWYRRFTTVSPFTQSAVPALLDGLDPHGQPTWSDHPDSLFSLLAGSHHLTVAESITRLCGFEVCGVKPVPPPDPAGVEVGDAPPTDVETAPRWGRLLRSTWQVWAERVTPGVDPPDQAFDDFVEELDPVGTTGTAEPPATANGDQDLTPEQVELERFLAGRVNGQPTRHQIFVDALRATDEPFFAFLHLILPHQPWMLREDGVTYDVAADRLDYEDTDDPWPVRVYEQRHLLQAEYADRLLGVILDRLEEVDEYEDSLIVVVADHGVAFTPGEPSRRVTDGNLEQIAYAPLLIKAPGQDAGRIDDSNINSTDVTPTVADLLGITVPWKIDGSPAGSATADRGGAKYIHSFTDAYDYEFLGVVEFDDDVAYRHLRNRRFPSVSPGEDRLAGLYRDVPGSDLIGSSADEVFGVGRRSGDGAAEIVQLDRVLDPPSDAPLLGEIAGRIVDPVPESTVVVAVNDRIAGVSPLYARAGEENSFVVLLPGDTLRSTTNTIRVATRGPDGTLTELAVTAGGR